MKIVLSIVGGILIFFAIAAGISCAREWLVLRNLSNYQKEEFSITGARVAYRTGPEGTDYFLKGQSKKGEYEFPISAARYENLSSAAAEGRKIILYRNPSMPSLALQKKSLHVLFEDEWRNREEVEISAKSTLWMTLAGFAGAVLAFGGARLLSKRRSR